MGERPVDVVDLTGTDVIIDLASDSNECVGDIEPVRPVKTKIEIPWMPKLPKRDPSDKIKVASFSKMRLGLRRQSSSSRMPCRRDIT